MDSAKPYPMPRPYTEDELENCQEKALKVPKNARKDLLIDDILDSQDSVGGS